MSQIGWSLWQEEVLDNYIKGYITFNNQSELAEYIGKNINSVKIKLNRRREQLFNVESNQLTREQYIIILANRYNKTTVEISKILGVSVNCVIEYMDDFNSAECLEYLEKDFLNREITQEELVIFKRLYRKGRNKYSISHTLNRSILFVEELIKKYGNNKIRQIHTITI